MIKPTDAKLRTSGGLTNTFIHCDTCLSDEDFNRLRQKEVSENETHILHGQISGAVSGLQAFSATAASSQYKQTQEQEAKERRTAQIIDLIEQVRASIEQMEADIRALEASLHKRDGDAWREKLALKILGENDIPQQEFGEDINAYRKRLEQHLINEMLNPDGTVKDKYKNDPKYSDYAEWAQKQYHLKNAKSAVAELDNDNTSPQRREQILDEIKERGYAEEMMLADREAKSEHTQDTVRDILDNQDDETFSQARPSDAALKFT